MPTVQAQRLPVVPAIFRGEPERPTGARLQPFCVGCQVFIGYDDILAALLSTGEMRMYHYLCPNGIREVVFQNDLST